MPIHAVKLNCREQALAKRSITEILACAFIVILISAMCLGQTTTGTISGTITDPTGRA